MLPPWMLMSSKTEPKPDQWTKIKGQTENERRKNGENRGLERGFGKMSKRPKPFEYKGKKKTRLLRESLWRDGLSFLNGGDGGNRTRVQNID
jgi:hypothetical protein